MKNFIKTEILRKVIYGLTNRWTAHEMAGKHYREMS